MNLPATFRGALDVVPASSGMEKLQQLEQAMREEIEEIPIDDLTSHQWCDGVYCRRFFLPKGALVVSKVHRKQNWFLLFDGEVSITDGDGKRERLRAPHLMVTQPGTKRAVLAHKDSIMYTFHGNPDNVTDTDELEEMYVIPETPTALCGPGFKQLELDL